MSGNEEQLSDLIAEMKVRFAQLGFHSRITVDDTGSVETIEFKFVRDNTTHNSMEMVM